MRPAAARAVAVVALAAACPAPAAVAAPCARYDTRAWVTVPAPAFAAGPAEIVDYTVSGVDPDRIHVTNGWRVMSTADGGCTWTETLSQLDVPVLGATPRITHLAAPANDPETVYAALGSDTASRPGVVKTVDGGRTWTDAGRGLEAIQGRPLQLVVAPNRADAAFLVVEGNRVEQGDRAAEVARTLFGTDDGGTWEERRASPLLVQGVEQTTLGVGATTPTFQGVAVDPRNSRVVWLYGGFGVWVSDDGARTAHELVNGRERGGQTGWVDLFRSLDVSRIAIFGSQEPVGRVSFNGGTTFFQVPTPGIVRSAASGRWFSELVIATDTQVLYQQQPGAPAERITPKGPAVRDLAVARGAVPVFYARTTTSLLRWTAPAEAPLPDDGGGPPVVGGDPTRAVVPQLPPLAEPSLRGARTVTLTAGERRGVPYTLDLPGVRRADVYFLVDVSESMSQEINGLRSALAGIISDLVVARIEAHFGVARFNTYDSEPYFRVTPVVPPGPRLADALDQLVASEGGDDKSHLEAVFQSVTGKGATGSAAAANPLQPGFDFTIPEGQDAAFRPEAPVKLVLTITDEAFYEDAPSPAYETVGAALRAAGALHVGLALDNGDVVPLPGPGPEVGLRRLATESGAVAPEGGVDCDGDSTPDIDPGQPLVCVMPSERSAEATVLANAIVNMVRSVPNTGSVDFAVTRKAGAPAAALDRRSVPVEFSRTVERRIAVTYACPEVVTETAYRYDVLASAGGAPLATLGTTLVCVPRTTVPPPVVRGALPPVAVGVAPAPQPPPGNSNPNPNPNPNPQPNPQAQPQLGAVAEPEEQDQLQVAGVDVRDVELEELAMSRRDPPPAPGPVWLGGAALLSAAAAAGLRSRTRVRVRTAGRR